MSDEYSLQTKFLLGQISAPEYERRLARLASTDRCRASSRLDAPALEPQTAEDLGHRVHADTMEPDGV